MEIQNVLPLELTLKIYDYIWGDVKHWKSMFKKVINYLDRYKIDICDDIIRYESRFDKLDETYEDLFCFNILRYYI